MILPILMDISAKVIGEDWNWGYGACYLVALSEWTVPGKGVIEPSGSWWCLTLSSLLFNKT